METRTTSPTRRLAAIIAALLLTTITLGTAPRNASAATDGGKVVAWGNDVYGQTDVPPDAKSGVTAIAAGNVHNLALKNGHVMAWGANIHGSPALNYGQTAVPLDATSGVTAIAAGPLDSLALKDGLVIDWGADGGVKGYGQTTVPLDAQSGVTAIAAGVGLDGHYLALRDGRVISWGDAGYGQTTPDEAKSGVTAVAASFRLSLALKDGKVIAWGDNQYGQTTVPDEAKSGVTAIAAGNGFSLALKDGRVIAWGDNQYGQTTVPDEARSGVTAIAAGDGFSLALKDGRVIAWGDNSDRQTTVPDEAKSGVTAIAAGGGHSLALVGGPTSTPTPSTDPASDPAQWSKLPDRDGDGIPDVVEEKGADIAGQHVDLPGMGADPNKPDIFLQINWMPDYSACKEGWQIIFTCWTSQYRSFSPTYNELDMLVQLYARHGINLHIDAGTAYPMKSDGTQWPSPQGGPRYSYKKYFNDSADNSWQAATLRDTLVGYARDPIFHHAILGDYWSADANNKPTQVTGMGISGGASFFVAMSPLSSSAQKTGTIFHELGHNLGLNHGGPSSYWKGGTRVDDPTSTNNCRPAYKSEMNYLYEWRQPASGPVDYQMDDALGQPAPKPSETKQCTDSQISDVESGPYDIHSDWNNLNLKMGTAGRLLASVAAGQTPVPAPETLLSGSGPQEPSMDAMEAAGLTGNDGDGGVTFGAPSVLFEGAHDQHITLDVKNIGNTTARYRVVTTLDGVSPETTVEVAAHQTRSVDIPIPDEAVVPTGVPVEARLYAAGGDQVLSSQTVTLPVLPNDPAAAEAALTELKTGAHSDVAPQTLQYLQGMLGQLAEPSPSASPSATPTPSATPSPSGTPSPTVTPTNTPTVSPTLSPAPSATPSRTPGDPTPSVTPAPATPDEPGILGRTGGPALVVLVAGLVAVSIGIVLIRRHRRLG